MKCLLTADFETTTDENDCRVWAWDTCEIGGEYRHTTGNTIDSFIDYLEKSNNSTFYFHNLRFDSEFLMAELFKRGFEHVKERKEEKSKTFSTLISDQGQFYSLKIIFKKGNKMSNYVKIYDSLKIIPFSVDDIAKAFNLPLNKLKLDYNTFREYGHVLTDHETKYVQHDTEIVARALNTLFEQNLTKMTQGSNALFDYKNTVGLKNFKRWFPLPDYDPDVRQSYKGGYTYLNPAYKQKDIGTGLVLDVNSLYPWVMRDCPLPYGEPIFFQGRYEPDELYPLYVQMVTCQFELKEGYLPTIQLKNNLSFVPNEYLTSSAIMFNGEKILEEVTLCLTSVDLELFLEHYNVYNPVWHSGWKFKATTGLFTEYIDKWIKVKNESTLNGNKGMRTLAKLMLNALYGKFALNPKVRSKIPYFDDGVVRYHVPKEYDERKPLYIGVGTFCTAWARNKTIRSAQSVKHMFVYADTDSLHLDIKLPFDLIHMSPKELEMLTTADLKRYGIDLPDDFVIDPVALGAWKIESKFNRGRYIRQKCYIEDNNPPEAWYCPVMYDKSLLNITCAGLPERCYDHVTWDNFHAGMTYGGKLLPRHVKGGLILQETEYTIRA